jgi:hypothetical protein
VAEDGLQPATAEAQVVPAAAEAAAGFQSLSLNGDSHGDWHEGGIGNRHPKMTCTADIDVDVAAVPYVAVLHKLTFADWKSELFDVFVAILDELLAEVGYLEEFLGP